MSYRGEEQWQPPGARLLCSAAIHLYYDVRQENSRRSSLNGITGRETEGRQGEHERAVYIKATIIPIIVLEVIK